ncbi:MAG: peptidoglycan DD-metalloendopeptidase family protein [Fusobacteriota bacterium]
MKKILIIIPFLLFLGCSNSHYNKFDNGTNQNTKNTLKERDDGTSVIVKNEDLTFDNGTNNYSQELLESIEQKNTSEDNSKKNKTNNKSKYIADKNSVAKNDIENSSSNTKQNSSLEKKDTKKVEKSTPKKDTKKDTTYLKEKKQSAKKVVTKTNTQQQRESFFYPVSNIHLDNTNNLEKTKNLKFKLKKEDSIFPAGKGIVIFSGDKGSIGKTLFVYHNNGYISIYYNLKELNVNKGDYIKTLNSKIATASDSFNFELRKQTDDGIVKLNPKDYLQKRVN